MSQTLHLAAVELAGTEFSTEDIVQYSIAIALLFGAWPLGSFAGNRVGKFLGKHKTPAAGRVFGSLTKIAVITGLLFIAAGIVFPSLNVAAFFGGLGLLGVAAGFAFQDILSNMLSGILLILREPFHTGDQITVNDVSGTVEAITIRETRIRQFDGRIQIVPNRDIYTSIIEVQTEKGTVRTSLIVGVGYDTELSAAKNLALDTLDTVESVHKNPAPQALWTEFGASSINLDLRYWTGSEQISIRKAQSDVVEAINEAFTQAGIDIPFEIITLEAGSSLPEALGNKPTSKKASGKGKAASIDASALSSLSKDALLTLASEADLTGRSAMTKKELVRALA